MKTQCSKSWTDVNIDFKNRLLRHCCKSEPYQFPDTYNVDYFNNSQSIQHRRHASLQGLQHPDCASCWRDYDAGLGAYKDWMNRWDDEKFKSVSPSGPLTNYIDIELDNTCDLSCIYCSSVCSSKIAQEEGVVNIDKTRLYDIEKFKLWFENIAAYSTEETVINFLGGEPTASKLFYELLDFIQVITNRYPTFNLRIEICTNCNSKKYLMDKVISAMDNSNIEWAVSISNESMGATAELIRYGLDWDRFKENFIRYITHPKVTYITLAPTVNAFSLKTFANYISLVHALLATYARKKHFGWVGSHVTWPESLDIKYLPESYKQYIIDAKGQIDLDRNTSNFKNYERFSKFLDDMEHRIGSSYREDYRDHLREFVAQKNKTKQTDKLSKLML